MELLRLFPPKPIPDYSSTSPFDYLKLSIETNIIEAHLCWRQDEIKQLLNVLSTANLRYTLLSSGQLDPWQKINNRIFITDMSCGFFYSLIEKVLHKELYKFPNIWIIFGSLKKLEDQNYYFPINSYIMVIGETISNTTIEIQTLYKFNSNALQYYHNIIGKWSRDKGFLFFNDLNLVRNRSNFMRMPLRVSYVFLDKNSLQHLTDGRDKHLDKLTKLNYLMYGHFVDIWNMTQKIIITDDWGLEYHPTKQYYKGMLGDLHYGRADISGTLSFTPIERLKYFKYLVSTIKELGVIFVFRAPPLPYSTNIFILPFDKYVWISCGIIVILCCFVIRLILIWEEMEKTLVEGREEANENAPNFLDVAMMQLAVVCQMDYFYEPRSTSGRIATFTLLLAFSYIYTAYSARIVLLLQSYANNLKDVKQLYDAKMDMGAEDIPYNRYYFSRPAKRTNEYLRKLIYENKIAPKGSSEAKFYQAEKGIKLVQTSYFAFHMETTTASNLIESLFTNEEKCSVRTTEAIFKADIAHLSCPKNSTYTEYFLIGFHKLFETGVHEREHRKTFTKTPKCIGKGNIFVSVGLVECYFAFEVFTIGVCSSLVIFLMEFISALYVKNRKLTKRIKIKPFLVQVT
nr:ionotropic receptor 75b [Pachyrhinus yasumatsui]